MQKQRPCIIPTFKQKLNNVAIHTRLNNLNNMNTHEETAMEVLDLALTDKIDTSKVMIFGIAFILDKLNEKSSELNDLLRSVCNVRSVKAHMP